MQAYMHACMHLFMTPTFNDTFLIRNSRCRDIAAVDRVC